MLSSKAKYAIKALIALAQHEQQTMMIGEIAAAKSIPRKFLESILLDLKNHGLLYSRRGRLGGYSLRVKPEQITLGQVIRIIDGPIAQTPCASYSAYVPCFECTDPDTCAIRLTMLKVRDATADILDNTTLLDAIQPRPLTHKLSANQL
jgi:Rrf2 family protein